MTAMIAGHPFMVSQAAAASTFVSAPALSTTRLNFGSQTLGATSGAQTVKLTNTATSALNLSLVAIGGANNTDFAQSNNCGASVAAGASCTIMVSFTPSSAGTRLASLFVTANTGGGPLAIALSGTGLGTGATPAIQAIVDAWNYTRGIAPGLWVTIGGGNFAPFALTANFGETQLLPTALGGVSVTFNGTPAALLYVSPTQINALVPSSVEPGPVANGGGGERRE